MRRSRRWISVLAVVAAAGSTASNAAARVVEARYDTPWLGTFRSCRTAVAGQTYNVGEVCFRVEPGETTAAIAAVDDLTGPVYFLATVYWPECQGYGCRTFYRTFYGCGEEVVPLPPGATGVQVGIPPVGLEVGPCAGWPTARGTVRVTFA